MARRLCGTACTLNAQTQGQTSMPSLAAQRAWLTVERRTPKRASSSRMRGSLRFMLSPSAALTSLVDTPLGPVRSSGWGWGWAEGMGAGACRVPCPVPPQPGADQMRPCGRRLGAHANSRAHANGSEGCSSRGPERPTRLLPPACAAAGARWGARPPGQAGSRRESDWCLDIIVCLASTLCAQRAGWGCGLAAACSAPRPPQPHLAAHGRPATALAAPLLLLAALGVGALVLPGLEQPDAPAVVPVQARAAVARGCGGCRARTAEHTAAAAAAAPAPAPRLT